MILIYSKDVDEFVNRVVCFLLDKDFLRIGSRYGLKIENINVNEKNSIIIKTRFKEKTNLNKIKTIWFNGGMILNDEESIASKELNILLNNNYATLINGYLNYSDTFKIGSLPNYFICNKLDVLMLAKDVGFFIPKTLFTESKSELITFLKNNKKGVISKRIGDTTHFYEKNQAFSLVNTFEVNFNLLNEIPDFFGLSQFQEKIIRQYEVRVVFLFGVCYAMAIFTNDSENTIDYRINLNNIEKIRLIPYNLMKADEEKLSLLMNKLNLNIASIDFIVDLNDNLFLLEVNQCGQISFLNEACNYNLEKVISDLILNNID